MPVNSVNWSPVPVISSAWSRFITTDLAISINASSVSINSTSTNINGETRSNDTRVNATSWSTT